MVSWVPQIVIPPLLALAFIPAWNRKWVMAFAPATFLADLDYLVPGEHRVYTHTLVIPALLLALVAFLHRRQGRQAEATGAPRPRFWAFAATKGWPLGLTLGAYYLAAHDLMDVFTGGVVLFWPFSDLNVYADMRIDLDLVHHKVLPTTDVGTTEGPFGLDEAYPWFTNEHAAMLALVLIVAAVVLAVGWIRRRRRGAARSPDLSTNQK